MLKMVRAVRGIKQIKTRFILTEQNFSITVFLPLPFSFALTAK